VFALRRLPRWASSQIAHPGHGERARSRIRLHKGNAHRVWEGVSLDSLIVPTIGHRMARPPIQLLRITALEGISSYIWGIVSGPALAASCAA